jgi:aspartate/methionine/tyrosine aminotransferase
VVSDEIYHGLVYEGKEHYILEFTPKAYVLDGFSKRYAMTGWRLGYLVAPAEDLRAFQKMQQNFVKSRGSWCHLDARASGRDAGRGRRDRRGSWR